MSDSFFGFNTTLPGDDEGLRGPDDDEDSELEYDALNDETFGAAIKGDWEDLHENLVQLERGADLDNNDDDVPARFRNDFHSLEQDLLRLGLKNMPSANYDDCESRINLDSSVWAPPSLPTPPVNRGMPNSGPGHGPGGGGNIFGVPMPPDPSVLRGPQFPGMFNQPPMGNSGGGGGGAPKMLSLEDIERGLRSQPTPVQSNGHLNTSNNNGGLLDGFPQQPSTGGGNLNAPSRLPPGFGPPGQQGMFGPPLRGPGGFNPPIMPPGSSGPHSPNHFNKRLVMEIQQTHPLLAYNRMNQNHHPGMPPQGPMHPMFMQGPPPHHPMHPYHPHHPGMPPHAHGMPPPHHAHHHHQQMLNGHPKRGYSPMGGPRDGNVSLTRQLNGEAVEEEQERDEYRNLMTPRDKQWLIGIQLLQLNTETPYIDDYYYAVYRERKLQGRKENQAHKDNQLNHPFSQPQGHAQLVLQSIGNRNHNQNNRNSLGGNSNGQRDRKNSESSKNNNGEGKGKDGNGDQQTPRTYTPLQFENSLGKLQCGSVTAPRKIIDMEIMAAEAGGVTGAGGNAGLEATAQRKCRQMLLHIETLYRVVLKLEDLKNPTAIEAFALLKEKKERERKIALEQQQAAEREREAAEKEGGIVPKAAATVVPGGGRLNIDSTQEDKNKLGEESQEELLRAVVNGLTVDKVIGMMAVRKGRTLLQRSLAQLDLANEAVAVAAWQAWCAILAAVPLALKKDREDTEVQLYNFCAVFKRHLAAADLKQLHVLGQAVEQKATILLATKFGVGALMLMLNRAEDVFIMAKDTINMAERREWNTLLSSLCAAAVIVTEDNNKEHQPAPSAKQVELLQKPIAHLLRFPDLVKSSSLLKALSMQTVEDL